MRCRLTPGISATRWVPCSARRLTIDFIWPSTDHRRREDWLMNFIRKSSVARAAALIGRCMPAAGLALGIAIATGASAPAQTAGDAIYAVTYLDVSPDWVVQGTGLLKQYRDISSHQAGNLGFTVLRETARPNRFVIVEGWKDQAAFEAHGKSADAARFDFTLEAIRHSPPNQHVLRDYANGP